MSVRLVPLPEDDSAGTSLTNHDDKPRDPTKPLPCQHRPNSRIYKYKRRKGNRGIHGPVTLLFTPSISLQLVPLPENDSAGTSLTNHDDKPRDPTKPHPRQHRPNSRIYKYKQRKGNRGIHGPVTLLFTPSISLQLVPLPEDDSAGTSLTNHDDKPRDPTKPHPRQHRPNSRIYKYKRRKGKRGIHGPVTLLFTPSISLQLVPLPEDDSAGTSLTNHDDKPRDPTKPHPRQHRPNSRIYKYKRRKGNRGIHGPVTLLFTPSISLQLVPLPEDDSAGTSLTNHDEKPRDQTKPHPRQHRPNSRIYKYKRRKGNRGIHGPVTLLFTPSISLQLVPLPEDDSAGTSLTNHDDKPRDPTKPHPRQHRPNSRIYKYKRRKGNRGIHGPVTLLFTPSISLQLVPLPEDDSAGISLTNHDDKPRDPTKPHPRQHRPNSRIYKYKRRKGNRRIHGPLVPLPEDDSAGTSLTNHDEKPRDPTKPHPRQHRPNSRIYKYKRRKGKRGIHGPVTLLFTPSISLQLVPLPEDDSAGTSLTNHDEKPRDPTKPHPRQHRPNSRIYKYKRRKGNRGIHGPVTLLFTPSISLQLVPLPEDDSAGTSLTNHDEKPRDPTKPHPRQHRPNSRIYKYKRRKGNRGIHGPVTLLFTPSISLQLVPLPEDDSAGTSLTNHDDKPRDPTKPHPRQHRPNSRIYKYKRRKGNRRIHGPVTLLFTPSVSLQLVPLLEDDSAGTSLTNHDDKPRDPTKPQPRQHRPNSRIYKYKRRKGNRGIHGPVTLLFTPSISLQLVPLPEDDSAGTSLTNHDDKPRDPTKPHPRQHRPNSRIYKYKRRKGNRGIHGPVTLLFTPSISLQLVPLPEDDSAGTSLTNHDKPRDPTKPHPRQHRPNSRIYKYKRRKGKRGIHGPLVPLPEDDSAGTSLTNHDDKPRDPTKPHPRQHRPNSRIYKYKRRKGKRGIHGPVTLLFTPSISLQLVPLPEDDSAGTSLTNHDEKPRDPTKPHPRQHRPNSRIYKYKRRKGNRGIHGPVTLLFTPSISLQLVPLPEDDSAGTSLTNHDEKPRDPTKPHPRQHRPNSRIYKYKRRKGNRGIHGPVTLLFTPSISLQLVPLPEDDSAGTSLTNHDDKPRDPTKHHPRQHRPNSRIYKYKRRKGNRRIHGPVTLLFTPSVSLQLVPLLEDDSAGTSLTNHDDKPRDPTKPQPRQHRPNSRIYKYKRRKGNRGIHGPVTLLFTPSISLQLVPLPEDDSAGTSLTNHDDKPRDPTKPHPRQHRPNSRIYKYKRRKGNRGIHGPVTLLFTPSISLQLVPLPEDDSAGTSLTNHDKPRDPTKPHPRQHRPNSRIYKYKRRKGKRGIHGPVTLLFTPSISLQLVPLPEDDSAGTSLTNHDDKPRDPTKPHPRQHRPNSRIYKYNLELPNQEATPSSWEALRQQGHVSEDSSFGDYLRDDADADIQTTEVLDDSEILRLVATGQKDDAEADDAEAVEDPVPTPSQVMDAVDLLRRFAGAHEGTAAAFNALTAYEKCVLPLLTKRSQSKITSFFLEQ
ncbi:tigger transposable element-derived protein 6-like [Ixodes scapularis]